MKRFILTLIVALIALALFCALGCGRKAPPVPRNIGKPVPQDSDGKDKVKGLDITHETGRELFELYGHEKADKTLPEGTALQAIPEEVPEQFHYLYETKTDSTNGEETSSDEKENSQKEETAE